MLLIGQSLELGHRAPRAALRARDAAPLLAAVARQLAAGARAIDLNAGARAGRDDLAWCVHTIHARHPALPLFVDSASPALIAEVLDACARDGAAAPLVANALPVGDGSLAPDAALALDAAARIGAGVVLSPRLVDAWTADAPASPQRIVEAAHAGLEAARAAGVRGPVYVDALAFPPLSDARRCRRSLEVLRLLRALPGIEPLTAIGNVGYGAPPALASSLRAAYAASAVGAGARALILPVEEPGTTHAVRLARSEAPPQSEHDRWLLDAALAAESGAPPSAAPLAHAEAARLLFG